MLDITITVKCPDLLLAATAIAKLLNGGTTAEIPSAAPAAVPAGAIVQAAPTTPAAPAAPPVSAPNPAPMAPQPPVVPVAPAPQLTMAQVGKAGADLIAADPNKMPELLGLLQQFGAPAITELKHEQLGPFATALRGLGAKI